MYSPKSERLRAGLKRAEQFFGMGHARAGVAKAHHHQVAFQRRGDAHLAQRGMSSSACWLFRARLTNTCSRL